VDYPGLSWAKSVTNKEVPEQKKEKEKEND
jgi:hypothetical protein